MGRSVSLQVLVKQQGSLVQLTSRTVFAANIGATGPLSATATFSLNSSGALVLSPGGTISGEWLLFGSASDYEARATMASGTNWAGAALSTWLDLATTRSWSLTATRSTVGSTSVTGTATVEIRRKSDNGVVATATVTLTAEAEITL